MPDGLLLMGCSGAAQSSSYVGPGDIVSGATAWYGLRAYNAAYATGTNKAINVRRASDNATQDIVILSNGNLDIATANTFAGVDATGTATATASTTLNLTVSSTPHVGSTITGAGVTQPCYIVSVGSFSAGTGTVVVNQAQTLAAVSISMQYGLYVTEAYDQTGNGNHATQATAGSQPQLIPLGSKNSNLPSLLFAGAQYLTRASVAGSSQPWSISWVAVRTANFTSDLMILALTSNIFSDFLVFANSVRIFAGVELSASATDNQWFAYQAVGNGASSVVNINGSDTTGNAGTGSIATGLLSIGSTAGGYFLLGGIEEVGFWPLGFTSGNRTSLHVNQSAYWGTP